MKHVALTGNMGSGKSTIAKLFKYLGIPVYSSDKRAKEIIYRNKDVKKALIKVIDKNIFQKNGKLNRSYMASKIFNDPMLLEKVNSIVHPAVAKDYVIWREKQSSRYTVQESALTYEVGANKIMDYTIVVAAPEELLIERTKSRDNINREQALARLEKQMPQKKKIKKADFVIYNGLGDLLMPQITKIHLDILESLHN